MSYILQNAYATQEANPEKIKMAEIQFEAMATTFNTMLKTCRDKCIPKEYGEADLNKGEMVCIDRCVAKYYKINLKIGEFVQSQGLAPEQMPAYKQFRE